MLLPAYINVNRAGIPALRSTAVTVTANDVRFDFNSHPNVGRPFAGLVVGNIAQAIPAGTTDTLPIVFTTNGGNAANVVLNGGINATVADYKGTGIYLVWVETQSGIVQVIS